MRKISKSTTKSQNKITSTPKSSSGILASHFNVSNISQISASTDESDNASSKGDPSKELKISQDDLDYAYNIHLLALATTKAQEKALSQVTAENENQKLALLSEVEKKRDLLAATKKRYEEVKYLSQQGEFLRRKKKKLGPLMDCVSDGLKTMEPLKNALDCGLPVKGFLAEPSTSSLKNTVCESSKMLEKICTFAASKHGAHYSETGEEVAGIQSALTSIAESQNRCSAVSATLSHAVLKESSVKVLKQRNME